MKTKTKKYSRSNLFAIASLITMSLTLAIIISCEKDQPIITLEESSGLKVSYENSSTQAETNFDNGSLSPYYTCTTQNPAYVKVVSNRAKFYWTQEGYDGTRMDRGAEICNPLEFQSEGFMGFNLYVPPASGTVHFPDDKSTTIAQIMSGYNCSSWAAMLEIRNNDLYISHRYYCGTATEAEIYTDIPRSEWMAFQIRFMPSNNNHGCIQIKLNGELIYSIRSINFAWGVFESENILDDSYDNNRLVTKLGMYCHDSDNYTDDEYRILYYDNASAYSGSDGWDIVDPTN